MKMLLLPTIAMMLAVAMTTGVYGGAATPINSCGDLQDIASNLNGDYILMQDVDCLGTAFVPIIGFTGSLNGQGFTISNIGINSADAADPAETPIAIFASTIGASIFNLNIDGLAFASVPKAMGGLIGSASNTDVVDVTITAGATLVSSVGPTGGVAGTFAGGSIIRTRVSLEIFGSIGGAYAGGLAGSLDGATTTNNSALFQTITAPSYVGGCFGEMLNGASAAITECKGTVRGTAQFVGGFAGSADGTGIHIENCLAQGVVTNENFVTPGPSFFTGCFIGDASAGGITVINAYAGNAMIVPQGGSFDYGFFGDVASPTLLQSLYWDTELSGQANSVGEGAELMGKNTAEMKTRSTFVGYHFNTIWWMIQGVTYPELYPLGGPPQSFSASQSASSSPTQSPSDTQSSSDSSSPSQSPSDTQSSSGSSSQSEKPFETESQTTSSSQSATPCVGTEVDTSEVFAPSNLPGVIPDKGNLGVFKPVTFTTTVATPASFNGAASPNLIIQLVVSNWNGIEATLVLPDGSSHDVAGQEWIDFTMPAGSNPNGAYALTLEDQINDHIHARLITFDVYIIGRSCPNVAPCIGETKTTVLQGVSVEGLALPIRIMDKVVRVFRFDAPQAGVPFLNSGANNVDIDIGMAHKRPSDLKMELVSPQGVVRTVCDGTCVKPETSVDLMFPQNFPIHGTWLLYVDDQLLKKRGKITSLTLEFDTTVCEAAGGNVE